MTALRSRSLADLDAAVAIPDYDRQAGFRQVVHLGVGGFHRAHQAFYLDELRRAGTLDWKLVGMGLLPNDVGMRDALTAQDGLYTLVTVDPDGAEHARIVGAISRYVFAPDDPQAALATLAAPETGIISLTITEGGYEVSADGRFAPRHPAVLADLQTLAADPTADGITPHSALGYLVAALARRRRHGTGGLTIMSCDNIPLNGHVARAAVLGVAEQADPDLASWIREAVTFPSSMVDRITPVTTDATRADLLSRFGVEDAWPVRAESFIQWVLEDDFVAGRPDYGSVGVQLVEDVLPYENMKLRLLNASHQLLGHLGRVAGHEMVHEAMQDPVIARVLDDYMRREAMPTLDPVPGVDLDAYCDALQERFAGEAVRDTLARLVVDASDRIGTFLLPVARISLDRGKPLSRTALVIAAWRRLLEDPAVEMPDRRRGQVEAALAADRETPGAFVDSPEIFGDLAGRHDLREAYLRAAAELDE